MVQLATQGGFTPLPPSPLQWVTWRVMRIRLDLLIKKKTKNICLSNYTFILFASLLISLKSIAKNSEGFSQYQIETAVFG